MGRILKALKGVGKILKTVDGATDGIYDAINNIASGTVKGTAKGGKAVGKKLVKEVSEKEAEGLSVIDKFTQKAMGLASEGADGKMHYKKLNKGGYAALGVGTMLVSTSKAASNSTVSSRGSVSIGDNMERFISYDGSGFVNNFNDVTMGDPEVMNDVVNHAFSSQSSMLNQNLGDIVFALHANREG